MTGEIGLFWWAPRRSVALARPEVRPHGRAWARLALRTGRPLLNFGDELSRTVVAEAAGARVRWSPASRADLVAIGSVYELAAARPGPVAVWGSGLRIEPDPAAVPALRANVGDIVAVRGPRTRDALGLPADTVLGDPGLLAYRHVTRAARPRGAVVIPHFTQWNTAAGRAQIAAAIRAGLTVIEPSRSPAAVLTRIAAASLVVSASLHGVIVAHALGVPVELIRDAGSREPLWKYDDYFASVDQRVTWSTWAELTLPRRLSALRDERSDLAAPVAAAAAERGAALLAALRGWLARRADGAPLAVPAAQP